MDCKQPRRQDAALEECVDDAQARLTLGELDRIQSLKAAPVSVLERVYLPSRVIDWAPWR
jgi:hypothetical protein